MKQKDPAEIFARYFAGESTLSPLLANLYRKINEGHLCIEHQDLKPDKQYEHLIGEDNDDLKPFVYYNNLLYTGRFFHYETVIVEKLKKMTQAPQLTELSEGLKEHIKAHIRSKDTAEALYGFSALEKPDWQLVAAVNALLGRLVIITGGPGTGKTTTVAKILSILYIQNPGIKIELAAPTGKAAVRMKESLKNSIESNPGLGINDLVEQLKPKTIHRLLGAIYKSPFFKSNNSSPVKADVVIIDESSMIGAPLFAKLLDAIANETKLILLGDANQLSSVDSGSIFGDLCASSAENENKFILERIKLFNELMSEERQMGNCFEIKVPQTHLDGHLVRLHKTYRYDANSQIGQLTHSINKGNVEAVRQYLESPDESLIIDKEYSVSVIEEYAKSYAPYIEEENVEKALEKLNNTRILCAVRESRQGVGYFNDLVEAILNKHFKDNRGVFHPSKTSFYHNQPILVTRNINELMLFNGDVGIVRKNDQGRLMAYFPFNGDDKEYGRVAGTSVKAINPGLITHWETVFAMTIHKSQGSEFKNVLVVLPKNTENKLLTKELIYTAITRGKKGGKVAVQAEEENLLRAVQNSINRVSGIPYRIRLKY